MSNLSRDELSIGHSMKVKILVEAPGCQQRSQRGERDEHGRTDMSPEVPDEASIGDAKEQDPPVLSRRGDELTIRRDGKAAARDNWPQLWSRSKGFLALPERYGNKHAPHQTQNAHALQNDPLPSHAFTLLGCVLTR